MSNPALMFVLLILAVLAAWVAIQAIRKGRPFIDTFKGDSGKGIIKGVVLALAFALALAGIGALSGCASGRYFNDASVVAGLESTKKPSAMCERGEVDERTTSHLGLVGNIWRDDSERLSSDFYYLHHSCAFGSDWNQHDAIGWRGEYKFYVR